MTTTSSIPIYELGSDFYDEVTPAVFPQAILRYRNQTASAVIGLENLTPEEWQERFWKFSSFSGNITRPLALRYHGHQFQSYNPDLGDGRGFLFAQFKAEDKLYDLGTKGSGTTPYSRGGDGRLTLKGAFREILATELLESYGVDTSKTFSVYETGEKLERHDEPSPTRSAVLVRMSRSHIRFGTFQRLAFLDKKDDIKKLLHYCIRHYYPQLSTLSDGPAAKAFLQAVALSTTETVASWMMAGFVHGVLNTDNMNITGESFDYGPYRFLKTYDPNFTAAYFDRSGLYAYGRQPVSVLWNLHQLGYALKFAYPDLDYEKSLEDFGDDFNLQIQLHLLKRLNLRCCADDPSAHQLQISQLISYLFRFMEEEKALFEQTFFDLHSGYQIERLERSPQAALYQKPSFEPLRECLKKFDIANTAKAEHPYFRNSLACSLIIDELEAIWNPIAEKDDWSLFERKLQDIRSFRGVYS